ncbi:MAG: hypothetical protein COX62_02670 [Deltaproteobacteria bacterium CG_4_10_14_0_2_um_filter_43_8]|nr:MAG: hypothetical protein COV43_02565 [Deltaproteobacteria bacterium CG11_big_fil_rev_8_21_14_0_20_42_23]PJA21347.1 MAG: hypothetical protein COX62_02670 [Deltaproteobacteria bacterium CG_4_10_14_0_2_um_filter_43_8]PJC64807.1 MAG: hypothetical protein CO021_02360 [Deltaproteobacteria bacterium CG_4_9_14_0_2_um_filter_42_21]
MLKLKNQKGFTLIEFILVVSLLGILSLSFLSDFSFDRLHLSNAEEKLIADIDYAKKRAMTTGVVHGVNFNPSQNSYSVFESSLGNTLPSPYQSNQSMFIDYDTDERFQGVSLLNVFTGFGDAIYFDAQGRLTDSDGVPFSAGATVTLQGAGTTIVLNINELGGVQSS